MLRILVDLFIKFETNDVFSEHEAWFLFRLAAIGEACGWTLLISGIAYGRYIVPGDHVAVLVVGQIHGMLFFGYALAAIGLYPNLHWSRTKSFMALLASVPPYGSLLFELWASYVRRKSAFRDYRRYVFFNVLLEKHSAGAI